MSMYVYHPPFPPTFLPNLVNGMGRPTIQHPDSSNQCVVTGVPSTYIAGKSYTIEVICATFEGGSGCSHILRNSAVRKLILHTLSHE